MRGRTAQTVGLIIVGAALAAMGVTFALAMLAEPTGSSAPRTALQGAQRDAPDRPLPVIAEVPAFRFTDQHGRAVSRDDLRGKVWIADFIFTRCTAVCPMMTLALTQVRDELRDTPAWEDVRLVSFSVDPEHDTPTVLHDFAERYDANDGQWHFLTGESREPIWTLSHDGFMLRVDETPGNAAMPINHSAKFVLVDARGRIRGYYDSNDSEDRAALVRDATHLAGAG